MDSPQEPPVPPLPTPSPRDFLTALRQTGPDRLQVAASLLDRGVDINCIHEFKKHYPYGGGNVIKRTRVTALYDAAQRGDYEVIQFLLSRGADVMARNRTGTGLVFGFFPTNHVETLCALDGMRTSENVKIVQLAEEMYGVETEEQFARRLEALDELEIARRMETNAEMVARLRTKRAKSVLPKSRAQKNQAKIKRVESILPKNRAKKSRAKEGHGAEENREKREKRRM